MSDKCKILTCPSSGGVHSVHKCPQFQSVGGRGTGGKRGRKASFKKETDKRETSD